MIQRSKVSRLVNKQTKINLLKMDMNWTVDDVNKPNNPDFCTDIKTLNIWKHKTLIYQFLLEALTKVYFLTEMESHGGPYLNRGALCSALGAARLCQLAMGCAVVAMVTHSAGYSGAHGVFCMAAWCFCFTMTAVVFFLDATRLHSCLRVSWDNLTVTCAACATLM